MADATGDDRFTRDPYLADSNCCSLLVVPILRRGTLGAVLVLENGLFRGAFSTERLDAVKLDLRANWPSRWTTPSCTPSSLARARESSPSATRHAGASGETCTTALSSGS